MPAYVIAEHINMRRREFISLVGATVAWPLAARAQQPAMPVIGFLDWRSPEALTERLRGFRQGLKETGYVEGDNTTILYRWAGNQLDRLPALAAELARRPVAVVVASGGPHVALSAKAEITTIPIVFLAAEDPVRLGLVASLARPGGKSHGYQFLQCRAGCEAAGTHACVSARSHARGGARQSYWSKYQVHVARRGTGGPGHETANPDDKRQHEP